jgi:hypothetical protein
MKKINILFVVFLIIASTGCKKYLDVNNNPNGPSSADPALYLPSMQEQMALGIQFDARALATIIQNWSHNSTGNSYAPFEQHGYIKGSDAAGDLWRNIYWKQGQNMQDVKRLSREQKKWDILGAALAMEAWGWQNLTDYHGEIILKEAYDPTRNTFDYDTQDTVYAYVKRECMEALGELNKSTDAVGSPIFSKFDLIYKGDRVKWMKFVNGLLAINAHHLIKKGNYNPDEVISYVDKSFTSNSDDALVPFNGSNSTDANFFGPMRGNIGIYGQSGFIVRLTNGSIFGARDPRQYIMLAPSGDSVWRGLAPYTGQSSTVSATNAGVRSVWGTTLGSNTPPAGTVGRYLYQDKAPFPLMTYAMLQFIKAEAAFKKGDKALALMAYTNGINASMDFARKGATAPGATPGGGSFVFSTDATVNAAFDAQRTAFMANTSVVPTDPAQLTQSMILLQKYIALWGYGFIETWVDLRKFDYDPSVFTSLTMPTTLYVDNGGKLAYRIRPRYNSEYVWNIAALTAIGGFDPDYHTKKMWIQNP